VQQPIHPKQTFQGKYVDSNFVSSLGSTAQCFDHNFFFSILFIGGLNKPTCGEKRTKLMLQPYFGQVWG